MKSIKINTKDITKTLETSVKTVKDTISNVNNYALKNTENIVLGSFKTIDKWQSKADKTLDKSFKSIEEKQVHVFDTLESYKKKLVKSKNKLTKVFA